MTTERDHRQSIRRCLATAAVIALIATGCASFRGDEDGDAARDGEPGSPEIAGVESADEAAGEVAGPVTADPDTTSYTSFTTTEVGSDWCLSHTKEDDRSGFGFYVLDATGTGYFSIDFEAQEVLRRDFSDGSIVERLSLPGFFSGYIDQSDWVWIPDGDEPGQGHLWRDGEEPRPLSIEPRTETEVPGAPTSVADDGSVVAVAVYPEGFDSADPPLETRIVDVESGRVLASFEGYSFGDSTKLLPDGRRVVVEVDGGWEVQDPVDGSTLAELPGPSFGFGSVTLSPDRRLLLTSWIEAPGEGERAGRSTTQVFDLDDLSEPVSSFEARMLSVSPDGRYVWTSESEEGRNDDGEAVPQTIAIRDTISGQPVVGPFATPHGYGGSSPSPTGPRCRVWRHSAATRPTPPPGPRRAQARACTSSISTLARSST